MRTDWHGEPGRSAKRDVSVLVYASTTWPELLGGRRIAKNWSSFTTYQIGDLAYGPNLDEYYSCTVPHLDSDPEDGSSYWRAAVDADFDLPTPFDLSPYLTSGSHSSSELRCSFTYTGTLPPTGSLIVVRDNITNQTLWTGMLENYDSRSTSRGSVSYTLTARSRDASPLWRRTPWATDVYPVATEFAVIIADILTALGLDPAEYPTVNPYGRWTPHTTTQLGDMTAWDMLSVILFSAMLEPWVDALGRFKPISRDVRRSPDFVIASSAVVTITGSKSALPLTAFVLKWLDQNLTKTEQQEQVLAEASITAGFFKLKETKKVYWSKDRSQRAANTHMRTLTSVNDGLLPNVGNESYDELDPFSGRITVETNAWVPTLATIMLVLLLVSAAIPDVVIALFGGITVPVGRIIQCAAEIVILLIMMSIGTGQYEIWGVPFDYVHARNTTEAYRTGVRQWERAEVVVENDFITNEEHAQGVSVAELLYRSFSASSQSAEVADDPRIEPGDIGLLAGATRFYVTDYYRDITRGAPNTLRLEGFRV